MCCEFVTYACVLVQVRIDCGGTETRICNAPEVQKAPIRLTCDRRSPDLSGNFELNLWQPTEAYVGAAEPLETYRA